jgi:tripartite-type tricarboxylate transporter receptor subunit TctC
MCSIKRGLLLAAVAVFFAASVQTQAYAQTYPDRPVRVIISFAPGGGADLIARTVAAKLQESMGKPFIVENLPGGSGGSLGVETVVRSAPDGYTLLITPNGPIAIASHLQKPSYDVLKDLAPVGMAAFAGSGIAVPASLPVQTISDLVKVSKETPKGLSYGHTGVGTQGHLAGEMLRIMTGANLTGVAYKGNSPTVAALLSSETQVAISDLVSLLPHVEQGKLRLIAVTNSTRQSIVPNVPTVAEQGYPEYSADAWAGMFAPANTPPDVINRLNAELGRAMQLPDVRKTFANLGMDATSMTPDAMRKFVMQDYARWGQVIKSANITSD